MIYRKLDNISEKISLLGLGSMRFPLKSDGEIDEEQVREMVKYAMDNGVTYYDHALFYHDFKSESLMGEILSGYDRSSFYIADKLPLWHCKTEEDVDKVFHQQLKNMQTDYFDFYLLHAVSKKYIKLFKELNVAQKFREWKKQGKIKHIGFSYHDDSETFSEAANLFEWEFALLQLNYMDIEHQQGMAGYELLKTMNIPVFVMEPVKGGNLASFNSSINQMFTNYNPDESIASWAIKWLANLDNVAVIVSGMSNLEQLKDNVQTVSNFKGLSAQELQIIEDVRKQVKNRVKVNCTGCNYCMPCPTGVNIPKAFATLNDFSMYENEKFLDWAYGLLYRDKQLPNQCVECGKCVPLCPQKLDIPKLLKEVEKIDPRQ